MPQYLIALRLPAVARVNIPCLDDATLAGGSFLTPLLKPVEPFQVTFQVNHWGRKKSEVPRPIAAQGSGAAPHLTRGSFRHLTSRQCCSVLPFP
jgi:hypothetical protein